MRKNGIQYHSFTSLALSQRSFRGTNIHFKKRSEIYFLISTTIDDFYTLGTL